VPQRPQQLTVLTRLQYSHIISFISATIDITKYASKSEKQVEFLAQ